MEKTFKISSALKNIIGRDLITNDYIAVFELIKNSYDAGATRVEVTFEHHGENDKQPTLIIKDDGVGMDIHDIQDKWLFVAYSSKRKEENYRDLISNKRIQAGAKGIGRFSCDKLGHYLTIYTKTEAEDNTHILKIDWDDFEKSSRTEFSKVNIEYSFEESDRIDTPSGTILEILETRDLWDRKKLQKLRRDLTRLINPNRQYGEDDKFSIFLSVPAEIENDKAEEQKALEHGKDIVDLVNGEVENLLFENLVHRTTSIYSKISDDGEYIETELRDRNILIYRIKERNINLSYDSNDSNDSKKLNKIQIRLFFLDTATKKYLTRRIGSRDALARYFGLVSLYKNGFRVYPFGEQFDDSLGIDYRYNQGYNRYLSNRSLIGRIEIDDNDDFQESSSRDGGLIKNAAYENLRKFFFQTLRRFEKYVVDINVHKNFPATEDIDFSGATDIKSKITDLITQLSDSKSIIDLEYDREVVDVLEQKSEQSLQKVFVNFERIAIESSNNELFHEAKKASKKLRELNMALTETETELDITKQEVINQVRKTEEIEKEIEYRTTQNLFLKSMISKDVENIASLQHDILNSATIIENKVRRHMRRLRTGESYTSNEFIDVLKGINFLASKIHTIAQFSTKANFNMESEDLNFDICNFIEEYITHVGPDISTRGINFCWINDKESSFNIEAKHIEIAMILDNLIYNAEKAKAKNFYVFVINSCKDFIELGFANDGNRVTPGKEEVIFEIGYTTTDGSGLGLPHIRKILKGLNGCIILDTTTQYSTCFKVRISK